MTKIAVKVGDRQKRILLAAGRAEAAAGGPAWVRLTRDGMGQSQITSCCRGARRLAEKSLIERRRRQLPGNQGGAVFAEVRLTELGRIVIAEFGSKSLTLWRGFFGFIAANSDLHSGA